MKAQIMSFFNSYTNLILLTVSVNNFKCIAHPTPSSSFELSDNLYIRDDVNSASQPLPAPTFPPTPASCPLCAQNYNNIDSCAQAAPVLANFSEVIFNPGAFISVIQCACTDTFQSAYPQCVDCFTQTNQTQYLQNSNASSILNGIRTICSLESTLIGNVSNVDNETTPSPSSTVPAPTMSLTSNAQVDALWINAFGGYVCFTVLLSGVFAAASAVIVF